MLGLRRDGALHRTLRLLTLSFYGTGLVLGSGIYAVVGDAARIAGPALWLSFVVAAVPAVLTGLSYAELASTFPDAGAEYTYLRHAFPRARFLRFAAGLSLLLAGVATASSVAYAFGLTLWQLTSVPAWLGALALVVACTVVLVAGMRVSTPIVIAFTLIEALGLVAVVSVGAGQAGFGRALFAAPGPGVLPAAALVFGTFLGFEHVAKLAEETRAPARNVPAGILVCLATATFLYVLVSLAVVALGAPATIEGADLPLAAAVGRVAPDVGNALRGAVLFGTANTVLVVLLASSRMALGMARGRDLPAILAYVHPWRRVPVTAALAVGAVACLLLPFGASSVVGDLCTFGAVVGFVAVNVAVVVLRLKEPRRRRPFRVPGSVGRVPVVPVLGALSALALTARFPPSVLVGAFTAGMLVAVAWLAAALTRRAA